MNSALAKAATVTLPSHGGLANPAWRYRRDTDLTALFKRVRREQAREARERAEAEAMPLFQQPAP